MKEDIKNIKMGNSSTGSGEGSTRVWLGPGTFPRPPHLSTRWSDPWVPRILEFKVWNPDFTLKKTQ